MNLSTDEESQTIPLLSTDAPDVEEDILGRQAIISSPSSSSLSSARRRPQISFLEYQSFAKDSCYNDTTIITPFSFHGTTYCDFYGGILLRMILVAFLLLAITAAINEIIGIQDTTWKAVAYSTDPVLLLLLSSLYTWHYYRKYGPIEYSNLMINSWIFNLKSDSIILLNKLQLARYYLICKEYENAMSICEEALHSPLSQKHVYYFVISSSLKSKILSCMGRYEELVQCLQESIEKQTKFAKSPLPISALKPDYLTLAKAQIHLERKEEALETYEKIVTLLKNGKFDNHVEIGRVYVLIGDVQTLLGKNNEAMDMYVKGLGIFRLNYGEFPRQKSMALLHESIGDLYKGRNEVALAKENYEIAVEVFRRSGRSDRDRSVVRLMEKISNTVVAE